MFVFGSDWLLLSRIVQCCDNMCSICFKLYLGSIGCQVVRKTLCPVLVVFMTQPANTQEHYQNRMSPLVIHICK